MPLLDHSLPIVEQRGPWATFHTVWCTTILTQLNQFLPAPRFCGHAQVRMSWRVEGEMGETDPEALAPADAWTLPAATASLDVVFPDDVELRVMDNRNGQRLSALVALVTCGNESSRDARRAFAAKCAAYLQRGVGVVIADVASQQHFNLHNELMDLLQQPAAEPLLVGRPLVTLPLALGGVGCIPLDLETSYSAVREVLGI